MLKHFTFAGLCLFINACVGTDVTSYVDPRHDTGKKFERIIVSGGGMPLDELLFIENELARSLKARGLVALKSVDLMPPTATYTKTEKLRIIKQSGADGMLSIQLQDKSTAIHNVPGVYQPGETTSWVSSVGNSRTVTTYTSPGYTTGGYSVEKPRATYKAEFVDLKTGNIAWTASGKSRGGGGKTYKDLAGSMAAETVRKLSQDGFIRARPPAK